MFVIVSAAAAAAAAAAAIFAVLSTPKLLYSLQIRQR
jgi:hypothetical protein